MTVVKTKGGYQIASHTKPGKVYPKIYASKASAQKRIDEMLRHSKDKKKK